MKSRPPGRARDGAAPLARRVSNALAVLRELGIGCYPRRCAECASRGAECGPARCWSFGRHDATYAVDADGLIRHARVALQLEGRPPDPTLD